MADGEVTITMTIQDAAAMLAWRRQRDGVQSVAKEMGGAKKAQADWFGVPGADKMISGFAKMAAGALSVSSAIGLANREYEAMLARGKAAASFQVNLAGAQRAVIRNLSGQELSVKQVDEATKKIEGETGADAAAVWSAISNVLSARGTISETEAVKQVGAVAKMDPSMVQDEMAEIAGAALDMRKAFGGTPEQALGAMLTAQQTARVVTTQDFARNASPALLGLSGFGDSYREASALFSTISQQSADVSGRRSGTAAIRFAQQLAEATATIEDLKGASTEARRQWLVSGAPEAEAIRRKLLGSMRRDYDESETHEKAESDPTQKAELHAEAKQFLALLELIQPGSKTFKAYEEAYLATPEYSQAGKRYDQNIEAQQQLGLQKTARQAEIARGSLQIAQQAEARATVSQIRTGLEQLLEQVGGFGRPAGSLIGAETGFLSGFASIAEGKGTGENLFSAKRTAPQGETREIRTIDAAIAVAKSRLENAKTYGQFEDTEYAKEREAIENYIARQRAERQKLVDELARRKSEAPLGLIATARQRQSASVSAAAKAQPSRSSEQGEPLGLIASPRQRQEAADSDEVRKLRAESEAAERKHQADRDALLKSVEKLGELMGEVAKNTQPDKHRATFPSPAPQRPPATIGGN